MIFCEQNSLTKRAVSHNNRGGVETSPPYFFWECIKILKIAIDIFRYIVYNGAVYPIWYRGIKNHLGYASSIYNGWYSRKSWSYTS